MHIETDPSACFAGTGEGAVPVHAVPKNGLENMSMLQQSDVAWAVANGFSGKSGETCIVPNGEGGIAAVLVGTGSNNTPVPAAFRIAALGRKLPTGNYQLPSDLPQATLAFALGGYEFTRYRKGATAMPRVAVQPDDATRRRVEGVYLARDLINTPANDMGPEALEAAFRKLGETHGAAVSVITGDDLLTENFPMVHAVGRASAQAPRVLDMVWGKADDPLITLVGKGVTFDTGGLNIKPGGSMALMKKDMGGAANVMGLAHMIMDAKLPVRLRLIVGAVENAIAGNAFRPGDVLQTRKGITVEIGNTDAEGRLVLGDCLTLGDEDAPQLMIDMATLTGAARVALGPDLPPFYTHDDAFAADLEAQGQACFDPVWRMPLWQPYQAMLSSNVADVNHITSGGFAGSITAALFLERFVEKAATWAHFDIFGWCPADKPWALKGGEAQAIRALIDVLEARYPA
ncbi:M17 family metallopeptidase [Ahrensia sp. R2A130]|uniref:leucyl aminopeptidase family protein n=1 Tax=Ahrensia sp. R2A130 TaxID=744979 RepID=UPI0001E0E091|nr:leucyl aminopeptidase family protein [Ahrensia sp. R2A130]EFL89839.1 cytosol aminopeptidase [Ahrensia sp. R2A130]